MSSPIKIELLSPARDYGVGKVAIDSGADAVYIGAPKFGARGAAGNSVESIRRLCDYAHQFDAKVLVALNTLLTAEERQEAAAMAWELYENGVDALIVQDPELLQADLPPIRLHASTQCDNRSLQDVLDRENEGFRRVVLARELSLDEIATIRRNTTIELEAFVHGAVCVSYSGRCYLSEYLCGRSANRGMCAQWCRQPYDLLDKEGREMMHGKYLLSLRDMDRSQSLRELLDAGVTTLKIEGRLKDAAYVRNVTAYYRQLLDRLFEQSEGRFQKSSKGVIHYDFTPDPAKTFHRSATDYFLHGRSANMANWDTPKSTGEYVGKVQHIEKDSLTVTLAPNIQLHNGDGLCHGAEGFAVNKVAGGKIFPNRMPALSIGTALYRNYDISFLQTLDRSRTCRKLPVKVIFSETEEGFHLQIGEREKAFVYDKTPANDAEQALQQITTQLSKLGNTIYEASSVEVHCRKPYFLPAGVLNKWRREITEETGKPTGSSAENNLPPASQEGWKETSDQLMTCKYCLLYEMGRCRKQHREGSQPEPAYLRHGKHLLALHFNCRNCQMTITAAT